MGHKLQQKSRLKIDLKVVYFVLQLPQLFFPGKKKDTDMSLGVWSLSIVWYSRNWKTQRFRNWTCFHPDGRGRRHKLSCVS
jgi:hypothetical protein